MKLFLLSLVLGVVCAHQHITTVGRLHEIADEVNSASTSWTAHKIDGKISSSTVNFYMGTYESQPPAGDIDDLSEKANFCENNGLPKHFDAREHWPHCHRVIDHILDQSNCGSCWAGSVSSVFTDRVCIKSGGKIQHYYSFQQLLSCCYKCHSKASNGCDGGWPLSAWSYIKRNGLATGGDYDSNEGCQPYLFPKCEHHINGSYVGCPSLPEYKAPKCKLNCYNYKYKKSYKQDRIKIEKYYTIAPCAAQNEIYNHGPIEASFAVYEDFYTYKSGVYQYTTGKFTGYHAVRVIGWGEEKGVPYWLVANSWNRHWGDNGYFKIKRGYNELWIESNFSAGIPIIPK